MRKRFIPASVASPPAPRCHWSRFASSHPSLVALPPLQPAGRDQQPGVRTKQREVDALIPLVCNAVRGDHHCYLQRWRWQCLRGRLSDRRSGKTRIREQSGSEKGGTREENACALRRRLDERRGDLWLFPVPTRALLLPQPRRRDHSDTAPQAGRSKHCLVHAHASLRLTKWPPSR